MNSPSLNLTRCRKSSSPERTRQIIGLLKMVGVSNQMLYARRDRQNASFWMRPINHLKALEQARRLYRAEIVRVHPDKPGGSLERTIQLNDAWGRIEQRFKEHGHELW